MLTCLAAHIGAQAYAVLIDSYGGYILESFAAHSIKKQRNRKGKEVQKKKKKAAPKEKGKKKRKVKKFRSACILFSPCAEILLLVELGPKRV